MTETTTVESIEAPDASSMTAKKQHALELRKQDFASTLFNKSVEEPAVEEE